MRFKKVKFKDFGTQKEFKTRKYRFEKRGKTLFVVADAPSGREAWKIIGRIP